MSDAPQSHLGTVERLAALLAATGLPRMPSRVLAYMLIDPRPTHTARDLSAGLGVSRSSVSGAVSFLSRARVVTTRQRAGSREHRYALCSDHAGLALLGTMGDALKRLSAGIDSTIAALDPPRGSADLASPPVRLHQVREVLAQLQDAVNAVHTSYEKPAGRLDS